MAKEVTLEYVGRYAPGQMEVFGHGVTVNGLITVPADVADSLLQQEGEWQKATAKTTVKEASDG